MPDDIRDRLIDAVSRGDDDELRRLCLEHRTAIESEFPSWKTVPIAWRDSRDTLDRYVAGLLGVARFFADGLGRPDLLAFLTGRNNDADTPSPLERWHEGLAKARALIEKLEHDEAAALLHGIVDETRGVRGSWVDEYLPVTLGMLGSTEFNRGCAEESVEPTARALEMCEALEDDEGVVAYLTNLHEIHRYLGNAQDGAGLADKLATRVESSDPKRAARLRVRARIMREGEPPLRVLVIPPLGLAPVELDDLDQLDVLAQSDDLSFGGLRFAYERNRVTLGVSAGLTEIAKQAATRGDLKAAVQTFDRAAAVDPFDPEPSYLCGLALAELGEFDRAASRYETCEQLAAGWYRVREDRALVEQIRQGTLTPDALSLIREVEDGPRPPRARLQIGLGGLHRFEGWARLHHAIGKAHWAIEEREEARAAWRRALDLAENEGIRTRALTDLGATAIDRAEATRQLHQAMMLSGDLLAAAMARVLLYLAPTTPQ